MGKSVFPLSPLQTFQPNWDPVKLAQVTQAEQVKSGGVLQWWRGEENRGEQKRTGENIGEEERAIESIEEQGKGGK